MSKALTHLAWYLERKWKYRWSSCHYSIQRSGGAAKQLTKLGTIFVVVLFLWLVYISVWAATVDLSDPGGVVGASGSSAINAFSNNYIEEDVNLGNVNDLSGFPATGSATLQNGRRRFNGNIPPGQSTESEAIPFKTLISNEATSLQKGINVNGTFITLSLPQFTRLERIFYR